MVVKNSLSDLQNFMFGELERLDNPELTGDELASEIHRADAMANIADKAIANANLVLKANMAYDGKMIDANSQKPTLLEGANDGEI